MMRITAIVEGHGEVAAIRILLNRIVQKYADGVPILVESPIRLARHKIIRKDQQGRYVIGKQELERSLRLARLKNREHGLILIIIDADDDCPRDLSGELRPLLSPISDDERLLLVVANREFESWFIAARESLAEAGKLSRSWPNDVNTEQIRGAKEWLSQFMPEGRQYRETINQPSFTAIFDLAEARQSKSFDRFCTRLVELLSL